MKKTYIIPELLIVRVQSQKMISSSPLNFTSSESGSAGLNTEGAEYDALVKQISMWGMWE